MSDMALYKMMIVPVKEKLMMTNWIMWMRNWAKIFSNFSAMKPRTAVWFSVTRIALVLSFVETTLVSFHSNTTISRSSYHILPRWFWRMEGIYDRRSHILMNHQFYSWILTTKYHSWILNASKLWMSGMWAKMIHASIKTSMTLYDYS